MKPWFRLFVCLPVILLFVSCSLATAPEPSATAPLSSVYTVQAPIESAQQMELTLFFRYQQSGLLACETRSVSIPKDESAEMTAVRQLLSGPQASNTDLVRLFPHNTAVINVSAAQNTLMVTLSEDLLNDGLPADWMDDPLWKNEAPLRRKLTIQSLVATLTENFSYSYVQVFIASGQAANVSTRLDHSYFLKGNSGPTERMYRNEELLLTMQNTMLSILDAWYRRDYEMLYQFTAIRQPNDARPSYQVFTSELDLCASLLSFEASAGHSPAGGNRATLTLNVSCLLKDQEIHHPSIPFHLVLEEGIWKAPYSELRQLMLQSN